jgi:hypothetical protein
MTGLGQTPISEQFLRESSIGRDTVVGRIRPSGDGSALGFKMTFD